MLEVPDNSRQPARRKHTRRNRGIAGLSAAALAGVSVFLATRDDSTEITPTPTRTSASSGPVAGETPSAAQGAALPIGLPPFEDDFEVESKQGKLDDRFWTVYDYPSTKGTDGQWTKDMVSVGGGVLTLTGKGKQVGALCFCGVGTPDYSYGDYTFRIRMDPGAGFVINGAMLWPGSNDWPADGEVNAAEVTRGDRQAGSITNHWEDGGPAQTNEPPIDKDFTQWVKVRIKWRSDRISVSWDDQKVFETTEHIPTKPMQPVIQIDPAWSDKSWGEQAADPAAATTSLQIDDVKFTPILGISTVPDATGEMGIELQPNSPGRELSLLK